MGNAGPAAREDQAADAEDPANYHSYVLNGHLNERGIRFHTKNIPSRTSDQVVVMGEKISSVGPSAPHPGRRRCMPRKAAPGTPVPASTSRAVKSRSGKTSIQPNTVR